jgi:hypothetical protein
LSIFAKYAPYYAPELIGLIRTDTDKNCTRAIDDRAVPTTVIAYHKKRRPQHLVIFTIASAKLFEPSSFISVKEAYRIAFGEQEWS